MAAERVLIVDDDEELCQEIAELLRENGYSVENTSDPIAGKELIRKRLYDIAIFDYKMPILTGVDMAKMIKKRSRETKVFIISGRPFIERFLEEEKTAHLIDGVISKPFAAISLLDMISSESRDHARRL